MTKESVSPIGLVHGAIQPEWIVKYPVSLGARQTYSVLCDMARDKDHCWPSHKTLAAKVGRSVTSIKRYLRQLVGAGLIKIESWAKRSCKYVILFVSELRDAAARREQKISNKASTRAQAERATRSASACPAASALPAQSPHVKASSQARPAASPAPSVPAPAPAAPAASTAPAVSSVSAAPSLADFDAFWAAYPVEKQVRRAAAIKVWRKLMRSGELPELSVLLTALEGFKASDSWEKEEGRWIPAPCRWLEDMRWLDTSSVAYVAAVERRKAAKKQAAEMKAAREEAASKAENQDTSRRAEEEKAIEEKAMPLFEAFAARFQGHEIQPWERAKWLYLYETGKAPLADDVPEDNALSVMEFLKAFEKRALGKASAAGVACSAGGRIADGLRGLLSLSGIFPRTSATANICHDIEVRKKEV